MVPGRSSGGRPSVLAFGLALLTLGVACSRHVEEQPAPPRPSAAPSVPRDLPLDPRERKELGYRLHHEACQEPVKQINRIHGRKETDPAGIDVLSLCLDRGNVAWGRCIMAAKTKDQVDVCTRRLLVDPQM